MPLRIVRPGMFTTVQDGGRWGFQSRGVPVAGAMDVYSHRLANRLLGNPEDAATLEVTLIGPEIEFEERGECVVTGAMFTMTLNQRLVVAANQVMTVESGGVLKFGERVQGARAYIAVSGGIDVPPVLGSCATHALTRMGGFEGRALRAGDRLRTMEAIPREARGKGHGEISGVPLALPEGGARLRILKGIPHLFDQLLSKRFRISPRSDRMGYRLEGAALADPPKGELISHAVPLGAVQILPTGEPILLMADHATTGGYSVAGTVISADIAVAGQLAPGDWIEFESCSMNEADRALREREAALGGW